MTSLCPTVGVKLYSQHDVLEFQLSVFAIAGYGSQESPLVMEDTLGEVVVVDFVPLISSPIAFSVSISIASPYSFV